ncbi:MAG: tyrosine-type recombinase/integrase [Alphaproteobacteria bacterium]|nr:tyrosine-type recombinase/integrase [Alphaproteobacteria bacterium]
MNIHLTSHVVEGTTPPKRGHYIIYDDQIPGFGIRTTAAGVRSFVLNYRFEGRERRLTIGRYPDLTVSRARSEAHRLRGLIAIGTDPLAEKQAKRDALRIRAQAPTVKTLCERYLTEYAELRKKPSSVREDRRLINANIIPRLGKLLCSELSRAQVMEFHSALAKTPYEANRSLSVLSKILNLAELWELRADGTNPCRHIKKFSERKRDRFFNGDELERIGKAVSSEAVSPVVSAALRLLAFTGCRVSEVLGLRWEYIDFPIGVARLPDTKVGARIVALGAPALAILDTLPRNSDFVLPSSDGKRPFSYNTLQKAWCRIAASAGLQNARLHDFRHTVGTLGAQMGLNSFILRDVLGHKTVAMTSRYVSRQTDPLKSAADKVSSQVAAALDGQSATVVKLHG